MARIAVLLGFMLFLSACGGVRESRLNPLNWFGGDKNVEVEASEEVADADPRPLVAEVATLRVERTSSGAIIRATGVPPTQGFWQGELLAQNDGEPVKGVLSYEFRIAPPPGNEGVGTKRTREVVVATVLSNIALKDVHRIEVIGANNRRSVRR